MKIAITIALTLVSILAMAQQTAYEWPITEVSDNDASKIEWIQETRDLGEIKHNVPVSVSFEFKNIGNAPLIIGNVKASCGCTTTYYPEKPIAPGELAKIEATYNAKTLGAFTKTITVFANTDEAAKKLYIKGVVLE